MNNEPEYYDDEDYYEDDEEYLDYTENYDDGDDPNASGSQRSGKSPFTGLPGSGSRYSSGSSSGGTVNRGASKDDLRNRFGSRDDSSGGGGRFSGTGSSRFGGNKDDDKSSGGGRFGVRSFDNDKSDDAPPASVSPFGGSSSGSGSRFGGGNKKDDDKSSGGRFGSGGSSSSSSGSGSRFGGSSNKSDDKSGGSRFGSGGSSSSSSGSGSRFGGGNKDDDKSGGSRFGSGGNSSSGSGSGSRFGGGNKKDDDKSSGSRFGSGGSSSSSSGSGSRFGGGKKDGDKSSGGRFGSGGSSSSGSGSGSRFGGGNKDDDKSSGGRFGSGGSSSSSSGSGSRFGGGKKDDDKKGDKKDDKSSGGGRFGGVTSRFGGGKADDKKDNKKDDKSSGGGRFGGVTSRFGGGKADDKKDNKKDDKSSGGGRFGGVASRFGGGKSDDKKDDKKDDKSSGGGRFGGLTSRFGGGKADDKKDDKSSGKGSSPFSASKTSSSSSGSRFGSGGKTDDKKDDKKSGGGRFGGVTSRFGGGKKDDKKDDKSSGKQGSPFSTRKDSQSSASKKDDKQSGKKQSAFGARITGKDDKKSGGKDGGIGGRVAAAFGGIFGGGKKDEKATSSRKSSKTSKAPTVSTDEGLTLDNWLDIIGVGLTFGSLVLFFSAISREQAAISVIHENIGQLFGWGALAVPITMFIIGMWLIVRHFGDDAPTVDPLRVVGLALAFVTLLIIFQYVDTFNYTELVEISDSGGTITQELLWYRLDLAWREYQSGGGIVGAQLYYSLVTNVTEIGGFIVLLFTGILSTMLITRLSAGEIVRAGAGVWLAFREWTKQRAVQKRVERQLAQQKAAAQLQAQQAPFVTEDTADSPDLVPAAAIAAAAAPQQPELPLQDREIRFNMGGQKQTVAPTSSGRQYAPQPTSLPQMPQAPANHGNNGNNGGGLFGRLRFGGGNNNSPQTTPATPPPLTSPLPMDEIGSQSAQPAAQSTPRIGDFFNKPQAPKTTPEVVAKPAEQQPAASTQAAQVAASVVGAAAVASQAKTEEDIDPVKARQERLNALRRGETGPLSQAELAKSRHEAAINTPPSEPVQMTQKPFEQPAASINAAPSAPFPPAAQQSTPPSKLPSAQPAGYDDTPQQQRLGVMPQSSAIKSSRPRTPWNTPDYHTLLTSGSEQEFDRELLLKQAKTIEETLQSFGSPGRVVEVNTGPVITQFGIEPDYIEGRGGKKQRVKVGAIAALDKDLQLALGARSIRVEAPVPGKGYVGIEVPNKEPTLVSLRDVMDSPSFAKHQSPLAIALGQSVSGAPISADLSSMPHLLIAGTTGSGKSVCVNSIITSIISRNKPDIVKFIMVDPKRVELTGYNGIPHLVAPVVVELERIVGVLKWVTREMDDRYRRFSDAGARNIEDYNNHIDPTYDEPMPYIVVIIDELADLMMLAPEETERTITRIAALARATGIHLVIATQRPSVDVVTGLIKANFPARIAFAVAGSVDSRVILDQPGAERLLGKGDMLYLSGNSPAPLRLQGVYVSDMEIQNIVRYWKMQSLQRPEGEQQTSTIIAPRFNANEDTKAPRQSRKEGMRQQAFWDSSESLPSFATGASSNSNSNNADDDTVLTKAEITGDVMTGESGEDELYEKAVELVRRLDKASVSLLQRRLRIGYTRAARLIDVMEARGVVGPAKEGSSKPRDVIPER